MSNNRPNTPATGQQATRNPRTIMVAGVEMDVTGFPDAAIDAILAAESGRKDAEAKTALAIADKGRIGYSVGPSGTLVMTGISSRGVARYGGQWHKVIDEAKSGRLEATLLANEAHLSYRDAQGKNQTPRQPLPNFGKKDGGSVPGAAPAPQTLAEKAAAAAAATMAARDAAEVKTA